jgi:diacylglycerol kinase
MTAKPSHLFDSRAILDLESQRRRQTWPEKFRTGLRGIVFGIRGQSSFFVHFFVAGAVVCAAAVLRVSLVSWSILLLCMGAVFTAELFNSVIETLFRHLDTKTQARAWPALDIAAGAVLWISLTAALVGALVFGQRLLEIFGA